MKIPDTKLKKGTPLKITSTGESVWLASNEIKNKAYYFICWGQSFEIEDRYERWLIEDLELVRETTKYSLKNTAPKVSPEKKEKRNDLNDFFDLMANDIPFACMECGKPLYAVNKFFKRAVTCHIFPKSEFPSIATNKDNIFFLGFDLIGVCNHHAEWDNRGSEKRKTMKVLNIACERLQLLKPFLTEGELIKAWKYLGFKP